MESCTTLSRLYATVERCYGCSCVYVGWTGRVCGPLCAGVGPAIVVGVARQLAGTGGQPATLTQERMYRRCRHCHTRSVLNTLPADGHNSAGIRQAPVHCCLSRSIDSFQPHAAVPRPNRIVCAAPLGGVTPSMTTTCLSALAVDPAVSHFSAHPASVA